MPEVIISDAQERRPTAIAGDRRRTAKERKAEQTTEAMERRVKRERGVQQQAARLAADLRALSEQEEKAGERSGGKLSSGSRRGIERAQQKVTDRLFRLLRRDDAAIRQALANKEPLTGIMHADEATAGDELLWLICDELKLLEVFETLAPPETRVDAKTGKTVACRTMHPPWLLNLLGVLSRFMGLGSGPEIQAAVLTDERWMTLLGFNLAEVEQGATQRSVAQCGKTRDGAGGKFIDAGPLGPARARLEGARGALSAQTQAEHESTLSQAALIEAFNQVVQALARKGYFPAKVRVALDSSGEEVVPSFADAGAVRKKVKVQSKARRPKQLEVTVRGFKVWYVMEVETGIPLAMTLAPIQTAETTPAKELIDQAQANLNGQSTIVSVALDRGFLDGDLLWWLKDQRRIDWVCPAKENMHVTAEARAQASAALAALGRDGESPLETAQRAARKGLIHEGVRFFARRVAETRDPLVIADVDNLWRTDFYGPGGSASGRVYSKSHRPTTLHATVVLSWPDRSRQDVEDSKEHDPEAKGPIVLLSPVVEGGAARFDRYDERSLIENRVNRDAKQHFALGQTLARNEAAMCSATVFSTIALMLYRALELHRERALAAFDQRCERLGVLRYRRQLALTNRGRIIIVIGEVYGMISLREFATLAGFQFF